MGAKGTHTEPLQHCWGRHSRILDDGVLVCQHLGLNDQQVALKIVFFLSFKSTEFMSLLYNRHQSTEQRDRAQKQIYDSVYSCTLMRLSLHGHLAI